MTASHESPKPRLLAAALALAFGLTGCAMPAPETAQADDAVQPVGSREEAARTAAPRQGALAREPAESDRAADASIALDERKSAPPPAAAPIAKMHSAIGGAIAQPAPVNTENYARIESNAVVRVAEQPVSTFSIDVDTGSYSNVRRMLVAGELPPRDAVRVEEMLNYFDYDYPAPDSRATPFRVSTEIATAPWNPKRHLLQIGIQGYDVDRSELPPANIVFLIDTSGSMQDADKLPLVRAAMRQWVTQLRAQDRVSIVVYAGSAGHVLEPTPGDRHGEIIEALDRLEAGGSTNGGDGIRLAYASARRSFIEGGINRVMLATDGDFNVGTVDQAALETLIERERASGVALSTLGFGTGNYNDELAERLADIGNGNHAYVDSTREAHKVLVEELGSTLMTIASDVKIQIEFNPAAVAEYRLIGYENRALAREDFDNDRVDAGEIGAGHDVTALYEIALVGSGGEAIPALRYGAKRAVAVDHGGANELAWLKLRYKRPGSERSVLVQTPVKRALVTSAPSERLRFAAAVAAFGDLLRGGGHTATFGWQGVGELARDARGIDSNGHRGEFLELVERARTLQPAATPIAQARIAD